MTEVNVTACNCMDIGTLIQKNTTMEPTIKADSQQKAEIRLVSWYRVLKTILAPSAPTSPKLIWKPAFRCVLILSVQQRS